jgi:hypothetical protein
MVLQSPAHAGMNPRATIPSLLGWAACFSRLGMVAAGLNLRRAADRAPTGAKPCSTPTRILELANTSRVTYTPATEAATTRPRACMAGFALVAFFVAHESTKRQRE